MGSMSILVGQEQGKVSVTVLKIEGDIDAGTYNELQDKADEVIAAGATNILLDLGLVEYMGSAGFRAIHVIANLLMGRIWIIFKNPLGHYFLEVMQLL